MRLPSLYLPQLSDNCSSLESQLLTVMQQINNMQIKILRANYCGKGTSCKLLIYKSILQNVSVFHWLWVNMPTLSTGRCLDTLTSCGEDWQPHYHSGNWISRDSLLCGCCNTQKRCLDPCCVVSLQYWSLLSMNWAGKVKIVSTVKHSSTSPPARFKWPFRLNTFEHVPTQ